MRNCSGVGSLIIEPNLRRGTCPEYARVHARVKRNREYVRAPRLVKHNRK